MVRATMLRRRASDNLLRQPPQRLGDRFDPPEPVIAAE